MKNMYGVGKRLLQSQAWSDIKLLDSGDRVPLISTPLHNTRPQRSMSGMLLRSGFVVRLVLDMFTASQTLARPAGQLAS